MEERRSGGEEARGEEGLWDRKRGTGEKMKCDDKRKSGREERITSIRSKRRRRGERRFLAMRVLEIPAVGEGGWRMRKG